MYINFWYAADWSHALGDTPRRVRMLGHDVWTRIHLTPARRESKSWVLEPVPLVPASPPVASGTGDARASLTGTG